MIKMTKISLVVEPWDHVYISACKTANFLLNVNSLPLAEFCREVCVKMSGKKHSLEQRKLMYLPRHYETLQLRYALM